MSEPSSTKDQEFGSRPVEPTEPAGSKKVRKALAQARRALTEEELATPGAQKMLLDELDRLDAENADLVQGQERFHETDKRCAVLEATVKQGQKDDLSTDLIFTGCMTVGGVALGFLPSLWPIGAAYFGTGAVIGAVLIGIGIAAKIVKYR